MSESDRGWFISLEGGEGAGKSTQVRRLHEWLEARGRPALVSRQPGGTPLSEKIRDLLKDGDHHEMDPVTEMLLLFADRAQFVAEVLRPALDRGVSVVCDRFTDSTYAYQGGGRGVSTERIAALEALVHPGLQPDLTLLLDLDVGQGMQRAAARSGADRFEQEAGAFFERVRQAYLDRARQEPERFTVVDAGQSPAAVWRQIEAVLEERFPS